MTNAAPASRFRRLTELDEARALRAPGARLEALRRAARPLRDRIADSGPCVSVRTFDIATFPYPTRYGFAGAALSPAPYVMMRNRMHLVQVESEGRLVNVLLNPTDAERSLQAPFFAQQIERYGSLISRRVLSTRHGAVLGHLAACGVAPEDIDYVTFDHLHVQDLRGLLGTEEPEPGRSEPTPALLPNARLLVQRQELFPFEAPHPLTRYWYVADGLAGVPASKIVELDGDVLVGGGLALIRTPGHTEGNHTAVLVTDRGLWTVSENGIAPESYAPECSSIPGLRRHAREAEVEVVLNANTREHTLDQYSSMVLEKTLADPCPDRPEFPQHFPSSGLVRSRLAPGLAPTFSYDAITHGAVRRSEAAA